MTIPDRQNLTALFAYGLGVQPTRAQIELFEADLSRSSLELIYDSLREIRGSGIRGQTGLDLRSVVFAVYARKLAEISRLFPIFFVFESSFRAFVAGRLAAIYGADDWWRPIDRAVRNSSDPLLLRTLNGQPVARSTLRTVSRVLCSVRDAGAPSPNTGYDVISSGTMATVGSLIEQHWGDMIDSFHSGHMYRPHGRLTKTEFGELFKRVRLARNEAYHHRSVPAQARVVEIAEELLDFLDVHLEHSCRNVNAARLTPLRFKVQKEPRHA
ncbi:hypothetical protein [Pseudochelatococcus contaminans]|uniref:Uncharacterized protein n=1 Tax=Pseudochelatococcus contaminans TaxID=1538103 RepID=A0A7W5Z5I9_9HYPH|nr:hypothetical protein [Pseudochelatococcus contaminans]MBB3810578.1 hypothetical protein [Pseudochelatococcus contaminans]